ncbi:amidohydrolase family protein [Zhongshania aquimaris]|uniref:Amidohydrolase n=1 Tax=Zhongshania aquimaris TaxID=2857107 RepID=A0ABS6VXG9_9GAMM|nr:amidohydrolase family protein [Zhongshania aquimaris]MBW2942728.1 amidohydrolase [Zhongshania aquimaris]
MGNSAAVKSNEPVSMASTKRRIVDADAHVEPPYEMWREYLPSELRDLAPYIEEGDEHDWIVFEGNRRPVRLISNMAGKEGKDFKMFGKRSEMRKIWLPDVRLADMDTDGMDAAVMFGGGPLGTKNPDLYIASFDAYNRWVWDYAGRDRSRLVPVGYVPMRDLDETIAMIKSLAVLGFRNINIPAFPQSKDGISTSATVKALKSSQSSALTGDPSGETSYRDPEFDRLWQVVTDLDITLTMHLGGRVPRFGEKQHFLPDLVMSKTAMAEPVAIMIYGAVFQRFPALRLAIVESGVGWMAWMAEYMDRTWERQRHWMDSPLLEKPSLFLDKNIYASFIHDRVGILNRNLPGGKNIMWSSDYPHSETTFPHSMDVIARDFNGVPDADIDEIVCKRAERLYGLV